MFSVSGVATAEFAHVHYFDFQVFIKFSFCLVSEDLLSNFVCLTLCIGAFNFLEKNLKIF